jgi:hypothetical protein
VCVVWHVENIARNLPKAWDGLAQGVSRLGKWREPGRYVLCRTTAAGGERVRSVWRAS